jgi:hypothetical protein
LDGELAGLNRVLAVTVGKQWTALSAAEIDGLTAKLKLMTTAIESSTKLRVEVDKPDRSEISDLIYLFVGINTGEQ